MNKIIVSIVFAIILVIGINKVADVIYYVEKPEKSSAFQVDMTTTASTTTAEKSSENSGTEDIMALFASVNPNEPKKIFSKCISCHNITGDKHKIGPNLKNVILRKIGSAPGYNYSKALVSYGKTKTWNVQELNGFLTNPKKWIPSNKMSFLGLKKPKDRAAIILYLNQNSGNPLPLQ